MNVAEDRYRPGEHHGDARAVVDRFRDPLFEHVRDTQTDED